MAHAHDGGRVNTVSLLYLPLCVSPSHDFFLLFLISFFRSLSVVLSEIYVFVVISISSIVALFLD